MMKKLLFWCLTKLFPLEVINRNGDYMWRWHLSDSPKGKWYLHYFIRGDEDDAPHQHPWNFKTLVLSGTYDDEQWDVKNHVAYV